MRNEMMKLIPHHRPHIPNSLAIFAAVLLLFTSLVGFESRQEMYSSGQELISSPNASSAKADGENDAVEYKSHGLNLGLLLFRRG